MNPQPPPRLPKLCGLIATLLSAAPAATVSAQPTPGPMPFLIGAPAAEASTQATNFLLRWKPTPSVRLYELQVARDSAFAGIGFDGAVNGLEHRVTGLPPYRHHWRVASAPMGTGRFRQGEAAESPALAVMSPTLLPFPSPTLMPRIAATLVRTATVVVLRSPVDVGWQAAVGKVQRPFSVYQRVRQQCDLVAVNFDEAIYALEVANGAAFRTIHHRRATRRLGWRIDDGGNGSALIVGGDTTRRTARAVGMSSAAGGAAAQ